MGPGNTEQVALDFEWCMKEALLEAEKSKDPITKVGTVIVKNGVIMARGHNHMSVECFDNDNHWNDKFMKQMFVVHSETDALWNGIRSGHGEHYRDSTLFVTLSPCNDCAKQISQSGIKRVVYLAFRDKEKYNYAAKMMNKAGIEVLDYTPKADQALLLYKQKYDYNYVAVDEMCSQ